MILITGATGLVGSHLAFYLTNMGLNVKAIYRNKKNIEKTRYLFSIYSSNFERLFNKIEWIKADITDITSLEAAFDKVSQVYHAAALVSFNPKKKIELRQINVEGTANLLHLAQANQVKKFLHVSSIAVFGMYDTPINEKTYWNWKENHSEYAISKYLSEMEVWRASQEGLPVIIVNPSVILGLGDWKSGINKVFQMIDKDFFYYPTGGNNFVDVWDVVKVAYSLMQSSIVNNSFIIGGHHMLYKDLLSMIAMSLGKKEALRQFPYSLALGLSQLNDLKNSILNTSSELTVNMVKTLYKNSEYSSEKLLKTLNYKFIPLKESIDKMAKQYSKKQLMNK